MALTKLVAEVKIVRDKFVGQEYLILHNSNFSLKYDGKGTLASIQNIDPPCISAGEEGFGTLVVLSPESLGNNFLDETCIPVEILGEVIARCYVIKKKIVEVE
ncbi:hypothetical protein [Pleionea sp. CnH1-48]|uniref:hypothetical protein n=1 Tax=Pleionea sp. CnH1-48 TaxID=2954494 RepID=UPI002097FE0D|nr:hypothetical protein [Pleionea sp. CnH1-48]MCO7223879.1 hypothetical protein [Pleionea sp. CnH1-48]